MLKQSQNISNMCGSHAAMPEMESEGAEDSLGKGGTGSGYPILLRILKERYRYFLPTIPEVMFKFQILFIYLQVGNFYPAAYPTLVWHPGVAGSPPAEGRL